jgi:hypothetical protein
LEAENLDQLENEFKNCFKNIDQEHEQVLAKITQSIFALASEDMASQKRDDTFF